MQSSARFVCGCVLAVAGLVAAIGIALAPGVVLDAQGAAPPPQAIEQLPRPAVLTPIAGFYHVKGTTTDGNSYEGTVLVEKIENGRFTFHWMLRGGISCFGVAEFHGSGAMGDFLFVAYRQGQTIGLAAFKIETVEGKTRLSGVKGNTETLSWLKGLE